MADLSRSRDGFSSAADNNDESPKRLKVIQQLSKNRSTQPLRKQGQPERVNINLNSDTLELPAINKITNEGYGKQQSMRLKANRRMSRTVQDRLTLDEEEMEHFIKENIKGLYISEKPQRGKLYFLFNLMMNRTSFSFGWFDRALHRVSNILCCCRKTCISKSCSKRYQNAKKTHKLFEKGKKKLTRDLDIVKLIQHNQKNFINQQVIFNHDERFLLQFQRRNVIDPDTDSAEDNIKENEKYSWKSLQNQSRKTEKETLVKGILKGIEGKP